MRDQSRLATLVAAVTLVSGVAACSSGSSISPFSDPCAPKPQGGALCIKVIANQGGVGDVIGYLASTESPLKGKKWRLVLTTYNCDPGTAATPACAPTKSYPTPARHGVPPIQTYCRLANHRTDTTSPGCHNTLDSEYATHGEWSGFPFGVNGYRVRHDIWMCISEQVASGTTWTSPRLAPVPARACAAVTPK